MRFAYLLPLLAAVAFGQPDCGRYKVASFTGVDSVNIVGMIGSFSGGSLGIMRLNEDATDCEFVVPTGTGAPVNAHGAVLTGTTTADTLAVSTLLASDTSSFKPFMTADTLMVTDRATFPYATASTDAVFDANKRLVSNAVTGTGSSVRATGPTISNLTATGTTTTAGINASGNITLTGAGEGLDLNRSGGAGFVRWMDGSGSGRFSIQRSSVTKQLVFYPMTASGDSGTFRFQSILGNLATTPSLLINTANNRVLINSPTDNGEQFQVTGSARISGATTLQSTLAVTGAITGSSTITATGNITGRRFITSGTGTSAFDTITANVLDIGTITGGGLFDSMEVDGPLYLPDLTANRPLYLDGDNKVATGTWSGTGTVFLTNTSPTIATPTLTGTATTAAINASGRVSSADTIVSADGVRAPFVTVDSLVSEAGVRVRSALFGASGIRAVAGVSVRANFTGNTPDVAAAFHGKLLNGDGEADTVAGVFIDTLQEGNSGSDVFAVYSPHEVPSFFGGDIRTAGNVTAALTVEAPIFTADRGTIDTVYTSTINPNSATLYVGGNIDIGNNISLLGSIEIDSRPTASWDSSNLILGSADGATIQLGLAGNAGPVYIASGQVYVGTLGGSPVAGATGTCSSVVVVGGIVTGCTP